ncbi:MULTISPECIES: alkane oxidation protein activator PraB [Pseudomonas]|uniref:alkane oxidation protein activator PraB n=1 Tax=Pseudomonas TaxID=286 RepID=UPI000CFBA141|nr:MULTISPECIES: alkane oxidation protein activator PraB [Pseudomonas]PQZ93429.1 protein activator of alkane oxidation PraB [Pseudomonas trivialis]PRB28751.1 protein activator of alkane oxidation PraB [Pseudomonas sp. MYb60]
MKTLKALVSLSALAVCMGAASMANAFSISPNGPFTTSAGSLTVQSPSSFGAAVTCGITFSGNVAGGVATITSASLTGGGLCALPTLKNIPSPGWVLSATSLSTGTVTNVGYTIARSLLFPATDCGANTLTGSFNNSTNVLTITNQPLTGHTTGTGNQNCTIQSLTVTVPGITIIP